jgi:hypothetical protein
VAVVQYTFTHKQYIEQHKNLEECGPCPVFVGFTLAFAFQLRKKHRKTSVRVTIHKRTIKNKNSKKNRLTIYGYKNNKEVKCTNFCM